MNKQLWWDGSLPMDQRHTIEHFQTHIETAVGEIARTFSAITGPIEAYEPGRLSPCDSNGFELSTAILSFAPPIDHDAMVTTIAQTFEPLGYRLIDDGDTTHYRWVNEPHDGYITLSFLDNGRATFFACSGCRPTDGSTILHAPRTIPDWEKELATYPAPQF